MSTRDLVKVAVLKEVFLAGSLLRSELGQLLWRQRKRNAAVLSRVKSEEQLAELCEQACDELTLEHMLVGVTSVGLKNEAVEEGVKATGAKKKRDGKRARKEETKRAAVEEPVLGKKASEATETPLRINMTMLVAMERREAVKAFAARKFAPADGSEDDGTVLEVLRAIFSFEAQSQNFFAHLEPQVRSASKEQQPARLHPFTAQDLSSRLQGTSVSKIEQALMTIAADQSDLITSLV